MKDKYKCIRTKTPLTNAALNNGFVVVIKNRVRKKGLRFEAFSKMILTDVFNIHHHWRKKPM